MGSRIASEVYASSEDGESFWVIASVKLNGSDFRVHYRDQPGRFRRQHPDWSPDGHSLVFERYATVTGCEIPSCPMRIYIVSTAGGPARQLIPEMEGAPDYWDEQPAWSRGRE